MFLRIINLIVKLIHADSIYFEKGLHGQDVPQKVYRLFQILIKLLQTISFSLNLICSNFFANFSLKFLIKKFVFI